MSTLQEDILLIAQCLAEAERRLRVLENAKSGATRMDVNRVESQVIALSKQLAAVNERRELAIPAELAEKLRKEVQERAFAEIRGFNPVGEWKAGMVLNRFDVVYHNGSSYLVLEDGVRERPAAKSKKYQLLAQRSTGGGLGGGGLIVSGGWVPVPPASATAPGVIGQFSADSSYLYICYAPNTWLRTSAAVW